MNGNTTGDAIRMEEWVSLYRRTHPEAERWAVGYGPVQHSMETQARVFALAELLAARGVKGDGIPLFEVLSAADRVASAGMWLVVHQTYARNVYLDGRELKTEDFKPAPDGHTGGSLNIVPAYTGYAAANAITGITRSWVMGQGHAVSAIDSVNLVLDNMTPSHAARYSLTDEGLTRFVRDFYAFQLGPGGVIESPLGSHVSINTAGGVAEGGYLGFVSLLYQHMALPGERLVVFLSDGAFEEQRGSDWAPRWWRAEDSGFIVPIMIDNGRRIDQRTTMAQGGRDWFERHLRLNGFDPVVFDGTDPAAFAWAIIELENRLEAAVAAIKRGSSYPVELPYGIAVAPKGAGFYGEGTVLAHNVPLGSNPHVDPVAASRFNQSARRLWVPVGELNEAITRFQHHSESGRVKEKEHPIARREVRLREVPPLISRPVPGERQDAATWARISPMAAVDAMFIAAVKANPQLRPRIGNPDEMRSNRMLRTLESLNFRVIDPEPGMPETLDGAVITALNEEAVAAAALGNKGGINIIVTYEAFGPKMHGLIRQELIWTNHAREAGHPPGWLSVPLILTSHTWENAKNEKSHQDPAMVESMLGEHSDISRAVFPADFNTAAAVMREVYQTQGQVWSIVVPKADSVPVLFTPEEAARLMEQGAARVEWAGHDVEHQRLILTAIGAYQFEEVLRASFRLRDRGIPHSVVYVLEPGRFRVPRTGGEKAHAVPDELRTELYPDGAAARLFVTHTRPEVMLGVLQPLHTGFNQTAALGFLGHGGTLNTRGLLFVNRTSWVHVLAQATRLLELPPGELLLADEQAVLEGKLSPMGVVV